MSNPHLAPASQITLAWMVTSALTIVSWVLAATGHFHWVTVEGLAVVVIAGVKVRFIAWEFMEVRQAPNWLRRAVDGWLATVLVAIVVLLLV